MSTRSPNPRQTVGVEKKEMAPAHSFILSTIILVLLSASVIVNSAHDDLGKCQTVVRTWAASSLDEDVKEDKHTLKDLLFFLHVPRTGGRTYFHCFLRKLYTKYMECPRSYDKLRFDPSKPNCRLLVTHDDYSMMSRLPKQRTSVVTILRSPIDRVLSTYEFSVEVAARFLVHPNLSSATQMIGQIRPKTNGVSTLDIWPWKYLVPWMREDLFARRDARKHGEYKDTEDAGGTYDMKEVLMPLHEFIKDPVAHDIIHDGATFQIAGLTNNSGSADAHVVRHCVRKYRDLGQYVLEVAKKRLDAMLYVGLTEEHKESATVFANVVGEQILSQLQGLSSGMKKATEKETESDSSFVDSEHDDDHLQNSTINKKEPLIPPARSAETRNSTMTVEQLMEAYEVCISSLRKQQGRRRTLSMKRISPANFSKEGRLQIPEVVLQQIISLNSLDVELYKHAQDIFAQQRRRLTMKLVEEAKQKAFSSQYETTWKVYLPAIMTLLILVVIIVIVNARRRTSKLKI